MTLKKLAFSVLSVFLSIIFCLSVLEIALKSGFFDNSDDPSPIWIPEKFKKIDRAINDRNYKLANLNPYGFTDRPRAMEKKPGVARIAVLGDSFIWGYGLPYEKIWSHKLENMVVDKYKNIEVMSWGQSNWSTLDEMSFLEKHGVDYDIDMLIVAFVDNDPVMGNISIKNYTWQRNIVVKIMGDVFKDAVPFLVCYINRFLTEHFYPDHQVDAWQEAIFSDDNLLKYEELLHSLAIYCNSRNIELLFVLTPSNYTNLTIEKYEKIIPILKRASIKYLNLFPEFKEKFGQTNIRKLWANPANGHPGDKITTFYAKEVFNYLNSEGKLLDYDSNDKKGVKQLYGKRENPDFLVDIILKSNDWNLKKKAAIVLAKTGDDQAIDKIINAATDSNAEVRESAVLALGEINETRTIKPLLQALQDDNAHVCMRAVMEIQKNNNPVFIPNLIRKALEDDDACMRRCAIDALAHFKDARVVEALIQALEDENYFNRKTAIVALGKTKDPRAIEPLNDLMQKEVRYIRIEIAEALGEFNDPQAVKVLKHAAIHDHDPYIRDLAASSVKKITGAEYAKYRRKLIRAWQKYF